MMLAGFEIAHQWRNLGWTVRLLNTLPPHKRNLGMVFQNYALFPHLTRGRRTWPIRSRVRKACPAAEQAERVQRRAGYGAHGGVRGSPPGADCRGGQQQRVALARALRVRTRQLVLMDEPLGALDKQLREHMQIELKELHRQLGVTLRLRHA